MFVLSHNSLPNLHAVVQSLIADLINMLNKLDQLIIPIKKLNKISLMNGPLDVVQIIINMKHVFIFSLLQFLVSSSTDHQ